VKEENGNAGRVPSSDPIKPIEGKDGKANTPPSAPSKLVKPPPHQVHFSKTANVRTVNLSNPNNKGINTKAKTKKGGRLTKKPSTMKLRFFY
jgi:hypothetical protein